MVFSSVTFLFFFLPIFLALYFITPGITAKNILTVLVSLIFYLWGAGFSGTLLLLFAIIFNKLAAEYIDSRAGSSRAAALAVTVSVDLLILIAFKYTAFLTKVANAVVQPLGISLDVPAIWLPLGISFYTFHCLSYVIDVYRRRFSANHSLTEVALYVSLFPQLVAGPIVRYKTIAAQLSERRPTVGRASVGARMFIIGLAQKVLLADQVGPLAEAAFDRTPVPSMGDAWIGLWAYTLQIYFDFAGYSNMAIGIGLILGFALPRNFLLPYTAFSITEFWRRWHISLSTWLRDYLYIPLGGNRAGPPRTYLNLWVVFLLCGLWHGAAPGFLVWGAWHGFFLVAERIGGRLSGWRPLSPLRWIYTLLVVMVGWVLFRAYGLQRAQIIYESLAG